MQPDVNGAPAWPQELQGHPPRRLGPYSVYDEVDSKSLRGSVEGPARLLAGCVGGVSAEGKGLLAAPFHRLHGVDFRDAVEDRGLQAHQADGAGPDHDGVLYGTASEP